MPDKEFLHWLEGAQLAASWRTTDGKIVSFCVLLLVESEGEFVAGDLPAIRSAIESGSAKISIVSAIVSSRSIDMINRNRPSLLGDCDRVVSGLLHHSRKSLLGRLDRVSVSHGGNVYRFYNIRTPFSFLYTILASGLSLPGRSFLRVHGAVASLAPARLTLSGCTKRRLPRVLLHFGADARLFLLRFYGRISDGNAVAPPKRKKVSAAIFTQFPPYLITRVSLEKRRCRGATFLTRRKSLIFPPIMNIRNFSHNRGVHLARHAPFQTGNDIACGNGEKNARKEEFDRGQSRHRRCEIWLSWGLHWAANLTKCLHIGSKKYL